jgi:hypothetical protein
VRRIVAAGARIWRTDHDGMLDLTATATGFEVRTSRPRRLAEPE